VNVPEVALHPTARRMVQQQVRLPLPLAPRRHEPPHLIVAAGVLPLVAQTLEDPGGGVPLLARRGPVLRQDLFDESDKRPELRARRRGRPRVGQRRRLNQRLLHRVAAVTQLPADLPNAQPVAMQQPNLQIMVHM
jgi:hypothetical protein